MKTAIVVIAGLFAAVFAPLAHAQTTLPVVCHDKVVEGTDVHYQACAPLQPTPQGVNPAPRQLQPPAPAEHSLDHALDKPVTLLPVTPHPQGTEPIIPPLAAAPAPPVMTFRAADEDTVESAPATRLLRVLVLSTESGRQLEPRNNGWQQTSRSDSDASELNRSKRNSTWKKSDFNLSKSKGTEREKDDKTTRGLVAGAGLLRPCT